jgi:hypothetical protein
MAQKSGLTENYQLLDWQAAFGHGKKGSCERMAKEEGKTEKKARAKDHQQAAASRQGLSQSGG